MIERQFIAQKIKELQIHEYISKNLSRVGHSHTKVLRTPLGEKIIIYSSRPGLVVGRKGQNIKRLTRMLKTKFGLENPQIEISEVENIDLDAQIVAERIADYLERFGPMRFKGIGHKTMDNVMRAGARGVEIIISGKIPGERAKNWRFYKGYLKKSGDVTLSVDKAIAVAQLKKGTIGIKVKIMRPDIKLPDDIKLIEKEETIEEEEKVEEEKGKEEKKKEVEKIKKEEKTKTVRKKVKKKETEKKTVKKRITKKKITKKKK